MSVCSILHKPAVLGQLGHLKKGLSPSKKKLVSFEQYALQEIMLGILVIITELNHGSTRFSFCEFLYQLDTYRICTQTLGLELI